MQLLRDRPVGLVVEVLIENIKWLYTQTSVLCHADPSQNYSEVMLVSEQYYEVLCRNANLGYKTARNESILFNITPYYM